MRLRPQIVCPSELRTIGYGFVQAVAPSVVRRSPDGLSREIPEARLWGAILAIIPAALAALVQAHVSSNPGLLVVIGRL
jgi:hypothetical protein